MPERQTSHEIDADAADWVARLDGESTPQGSQAELDAWLAGDPRRLGAYAKARAVYAHVRRAKALGKDFDPEPFDPIVVELKQRPAKQPSRRRVLWLGGGIAASVAAAVTTTWSLRRGASRYATRLGEVHIVPLNDGSTVTLNTASKIAVSFTQDVRSIRLIEGEALFDVAKDPRRPFVVQAGDTAVRAVGTSFTVRRLPDRPVQVLVREGVVEITRSVTPTAAPVRVAANSRAEAVGETTVQTLAVAPAEVSRALAWREGMLSFEDERLDQAAAEFARYSDNRIVVDDPTVAARTVTGAFAANNPAGFSQAVAAALDLQAEVNEGQIRLRQRSPAG